MLHSSVVAGVGWIVVTVLHVDKYLPSVPANFSLEDMQGGHHQIALVAFDPHFGMIFLILKVEVRVSGLVWPLLHNCIL